MRLVCVRWLDAFSSGGWISPEDFMDEHKYEARETTSVGYLVCCNRKVVSVSQTLSETGMVSDIISIPRSIVTEIVDLKEVRRRKGKV